MIRATLFTVLLSTLGGCAYLNSFVYKIDIPQGNYIDNVQVQKLRVGMTKEQVSYVLGTAVASNPFDQDRWTYLYRYKTGKGVVLEKKLIANFDADKLASVTGDYKLSEHFHIPVEQDIPKFTQVFEDDHLALSPEGNELWSISVGKFTEQNKVKQLTTLLEKENYQVMLFPKNAKLNQEVEVFVDVGTTEKELEEKLKIIEKLIDGSAEIKRLPES